MKSTLVYQKIKPIIEALLFAAQEPLTSLQIEEIIGVPKEGIEAVMEELTVEFAEHGIKIFKIAHGYMLGTAPEYAEYVDRLRNFPQEAKLTPQSLETLAIIAYKQPVTKPEIERIRGVFSDGVIETLIARKLIEERGRADAPGRPILYGTTSEFLKHFGLKDIKDLPAAPQEGIEHPFEGVLKEEGKELTAQTA